MISASVLSCAELGRKPLALLLSRYGLELHWLAPAAIIEGSFWGDSEAGLIANRLLVRGDTPVHSALHEACHYVCMDRERRRGLHTEAGGDDLEECAVCYLQIVLADYLPGVGRAKMFADMDVWGYSFRLGGARAWFEQDAEDAYSWLFGQDLIDSAGKPTWRLRGQCTLENSITFFEAPRRSASSHQKETSQ